MQRIIMVAIVVTAVGCATSQKFSYTKNVSQDEKNRDSANCELQADQIQTPDWTARGTMFEGWNIKERQSKAYDLCMRGKGYTLQAVKQATYAETKASTCNSVRQFAGQIFKQRKTVSQQDAEQKALAANPGTPKNHPGVVQLKYAIKQGYEAKTAEAAMSNSYDKCISTYDILIESYAKGQPISDISN